MKCFVMAFTRYTGHYESLGNRVDAVGLNPAGCNDQEVFQPRARQRGAEHAQDVKQASQSISGHVPIHARRENWQALEARKSLQSCAFKPWRGRSSFSTGARRMTSQSLLDLIPTSPKISPTFIMPCKCVNRRLGHPRLVATVTAHVVAARNSRCVARFTLQNLC